MGVPLCISTSDKFKNGARQLNPSSVDAHVPCSWSRRAWVACAQPVTCSCTFEAKACADETAPETAPDTELSAFETAPATEASAFSILVWRSARAWKERRWVVESPQHCSRASIGEEQSAPKARPASGLRHLCRGTGEQQSHTFQLEQVVLASKHLVSFTGSSQMSFSYVAPPQVARPSSQTASASWRLGDPFEMATRAVSAKRARVTIVAVLGALWKGPSIFLVQVLRDEVERTDLLFLWGVR
eukprot:CAMPEP_0174730242 /NCGR_PEP_ID=MMETSP1094-20130205/55205_1 /TAXON_ID=156173 /ORGANISM="Chrysochromulina brevifilum, Strain UTEX LB 985" /LENGTH=243 /DNA_ID=CAMNT_0015932473 /DNA_START=186 /DNA_END=914 /DNA_ORIENTATION=-